MSETPPPRHQRPQPAVTRLPAVPMVLALAATALLLFLWRPAVLHSQPVAGQPVEAPMQPPDRHVRVGLATPQQQREARLADEPTTVFFRRVAGTADSAGASGPRPFVAGPPSAVVSGGGTSDRTRALPTSPSPSSAPTVLPSTLTSARWLVERQLAPYPMTDAEMRQAGRIQGGRAGLVAIPGARWMQGDVISVVLPKGSTATVGDRLLVAQRDEEIARGLRMVVGTGLVEITSLPKPGIATGVIRVQTGDISSDHLVLPVPPANAERSPAERGPGERSPGGGRPAPRETRVDWVSGAVASASVRATVLLAGDVYDGVQPGDLFTLSAHDGGRETRVALVRVVRTGWMGSVATVVKQYTSPLRAGLTATQVTAAP